MVAEFAFAASGLLAIGCWVVAQRPNSLLVTLASKPAAKQAIRPNNLCTTRAFPVPFLCHGWEHKMLCCGTP